MARHKTDLIETLRKMHKPVELSAEAQALAAAGDPLQVVDQIGKALEKWRETGPEHTFADDGEFTKFMQEAMRELTVHFLVTQQAALKELAKKLTDTSLVSARDLAAIIGELGRQLSAIRKSTPADLPESHEALDRELAELEAKLGTPDAPTRH